MKQFIYIISDQQHINLHVGLCSDLVKTIEFYKEMPTLFYNPILQINKLLFYEEVPESEVMIRYKEIAAFSRFYKEKLIKEFNVDWLALSPITELELSPLKLHKDLNHSHYWIENGVLYESYKTIRGVRYRAVLDVPGYLNTPELDQVTIDYIEDKYLNK